MSKDRNSSRPRQVLSLYEIAQRNRRIATAIRSGVPLYDVVKRFGIGEKAVRRVLADMGVSMNKPGKRVGPEPPEAA
jgi:hypothetical protein